MSGYVVDASVAVKWLARESVSGAILETLPLRHEEDIALWVEGLRKAGVPE